MRSLKESGPRFCEVETIDGTVLVPFTVKRSRRLRYIRVSVNDLMEVTLKIPWQVSEVAAMEFFRSQGNWVAGMLKNGKRRLTLFEYLQKKPSLTVHGSKVDLVCGFVRGPARINYNRTDGKVHLKFDPRQPREPQILRLLKCFAKQTLKERTEYLAKIVGVRTNRIGVRDQRTVWGSCSDLRTVSLNWRIILLPPKLQDYLIFHELAHLTYLDHSSKYWKLLLSYDRAARKHDRQIANSFEQIMTIGRCNTH